MNYPHKVLVAAPVHAVLTEALESKGYELITHEKITQDIARTLMADCVGVVTSTRLLLDKELIDHAPGLRWIGRMGSGLEVIDLDYAAAKGIRTFASPEGNCNAVGEHAVGMLLSLLRRIGWSQAELVRGIWKRDENRGYELEGKTIGIIGLGNTGTSFARKLSGFDVRLLGYDKTRKSGLPAGLEQCQKLEQVMDESDVISFNVPLQDDTLHYFDTGFLERMRKPFILINTSRGRVVDTGALIAGLRSGKISGACLDVFEEEPLNRPDCPWRTELNELLAHPNVIATPHIAGYTFESLYKMSKVLADKISTAGF